MGHLTSKDAYKNLEQRINLFAQGAAPTETLYKILQVLYTEDEARHVAMLPIRPFTLKKAASVWGCSQLQAEHLLDQLCEKALILDSWHNGARQFVMPPPMAGFLEFALMRTRGDIDQKYLSELYYQYMNVEEDFIKELFFAAETRMGRVFVQESVLTNEKMNYILDYERASHIIEDADYVGLGMCYCRHKMMHMDKPCEINAPMDVCLTLGNVARSLAEHGEHVRLISKEEARDVLQLAYESNLVQIGENVREKPAFLCNCCGCCCEALQAARHFSPMQPVATTNYLPKIHGDKCIGCGKCAKVCPVLAIKMELGTAAGSQAEEAERKRKLAWIDSEICLGCGVCARNCPTGAIEMERRPVQIITPVNSTHRYVAQAIEKGTLQNLIFDNQAFANHRAMAAVFQVILKLPPLKQAMASKQFKSIYLDKLLSKQSENKSV